MNATVHNIEVSGCHKQINDATVLYSFPHDVETVLRKALNAIHALAEVGQRSIRKLCDINNGKLNAEANECVPMRCKNVWTTQMQH